MVAILVSYGSNSRKLPMASIGYCHRTCLPNSTNVTWDGQVVSHKAQQTALAACVASPLAACAISPPAACAVSLLAACAASPLSLGESVIPRGLT